MLKKKILTGLAVLTVVAVPFSAFAATSDSSVAKGVRSFFHYDMTKLSDTQKSDVTTYTQKAADLQKEFINKMLADGAITQEQATAQLNAVDAKLKSGNPSGFLQGFGGGGCGEHRGGMDAPLLKGIDITKLSDVQKADLMVTINNIVSQQKSFNATLVADTLLTQQQADAKNTSLDQIVTDLGNGKLPQNSRMLFMNGAGMRGMEKQGATALTDKQKADIADNATKMKALDKELIGKLQTDNAITSAQATSMNKMIDNMGTNGGRFGGHGMRGNHGGNGG